MLQRILRMKTWTMDRLGMGSPSLGAMGLRPTLDWVITGQQCDMVDTTVESTRRDRDHYWAKAAEQEGFANHARRVAHEEIGKAWVANEKLGRARAFYKGLLKDHRETIGAIHNQLIGRTQLNWNNACKHSDQFLSYGARERAAAYRLAADTLREVALVELGMQLPECSEDGNQHRDDGVLRIDRDVCPHGCGHRFKNMWDWDWSKGEVITECPACHKPVDLKVMYFARKGETAAQEATRKDEVPIYPDRIGGHGGKRGDVIVGSALQSRAVRRPKPRG